MKVLKDIVAELKETSWPTGKQLVNLTIYTIIICAIIALIIVGLDAFFGTARNIILNK